MENSTAHPLPPSPGGPEEFTIRFTTEHEFPRAQELWIALERDLGAPGVTCSWAWTATWLRQYGESVDHCFAIGEVNGIAVGIALVTASRPLPGWIPWPRFRGIAHIGTAGEPRGQSVDVEYNRLLVAPEHRVAFASGILAAITRDLRPFAIQLDGFVPEDIDAFHGPNLPFDRTDRPCPTFDLRRARNDEKDVISSLGSGVRSRVRRSNRGFEPFTAEWATTETEALDIYDELMALHQARWQRDGRPGAFASARFANFHREFIRRSMGDVPRVMLFRLRQAETTIGCLYGFIERKQLLFYQSGFAHVTDNRLKPGLSTHAACMQACLERGLDAYNFLAGEARYKRELANCDLLIQSAIAYRRPIFRTGVQALNRLGVVEVARSAKRWRERRAVAANSQQEGSGT